MFCIAVALCFFVLLLLSVFFVSAFCVFVSLLCFVLGFLWLVGVLFFVVWYDVIVSR